MENYFEKFAALYSDLTPESLQQLSTIYTKDVVFQDPAHKIQGITALIEYFQHTCSSLRYCKFVINHHAVTADRCFVQWQMRFSHPRLGGGKEIVVDGCSLLKIRSDGISEHTDYFDMGAMLYEQIPLLGNAIRYLKKGLAP